MKKTQSELIKKQQEEQQRQKQLQGTTDKQKEAFDGGRQLDQVNLILMHVLLKGKATLKGLSENKYYISTVNPSEVGFV